MAFLYRYQKILSSSDHLNDLTQVTKTQRTITQPRSSQEAIMSVSLTLLNKFQRKKKGKDKRRDTLSNLENGTSPLQENK